jgi:mycofactocin precursor
MVPRHVTEVTEGAHVNDTEVIEAAQDDSELVEEDLLVEDVSIDGMCGVY